MDNLKDLRKEKKLTQQEAAKLAGVSLRSYKSYENDEGKETTFKYKYIYDVLMKTNPIDEEHGILQIEDIRERCQPVFEKYKVNYCYLFGSYAKAKASQTSDVDLLVAVNIKGMKYYALVEEIRSTLHKRVDVLDLNQLKGNFELVQEILRYGVKIYG